jgi:hypothetical protein
VTIPELPEAEPRLQRRYHQLVMSHVSMAQAVAAGLRCPPGVSKPFAATQGAWRFLSNPNISLEQLAQPLLQCASEGVASDCDSYVLVPLDFCPLHYGSHASKTDRVTLANHGDQGYELLTALALEDRNGSPLAPLCLELKAADGIHSTRSERLLPSRSRLDRLGPLMAHVAGLELGKTPVFIIDREADSVGHYRKWDKQKRLFVVRADDTPRVYFEDQHQPLAQVADTLHQRKNFTFAREVTLRGKPARQFVAETKVVLRRPARTQRVDKETGQAVHRNVAGKAITLRLIVSEVRDASGKVLERWLLLSNLPDSIDAATVALWYFWRWRIESYHKLLKGAGQHVESWQQESAAALAARLAVAAMAAVVVWKLARDDSQPAQQMRQVLVKLSGRQIKRGKDARDFTEPALMAGLGVLIQMLLLLEQHDLQEIKKLAQLTLPSLSPKPPPRTSGA